MIAKRTAIRAALVLGVALWHHAAIAQPEPEPLQLTTSDGQTIAAFWYGQPGRAGAPAAVLVHDQGKTHIAWLPLIVRLHARGFRVLALDLRGHGATKGTTPDIYAEMRKRNHGPYLDMIHDVEAGIRWVTEDAKVPPEQVVVIGATHGGNLAIQAGAQNEKLAAVVAISPSQDFFAFPLVEQAERYRGRPLYVIITKQYLSRGASDIQKLNEGNEKFELKVFPRYELHGTQLLNLSWKIEDLIIKWLEKTMELPSS